MYLSKKNPYAISNDSGRSQKLFQGVGQRSSQRKI